MPKIGFFRAYIDVFDPEKDVLRKRLEPRRTRRARRKTGISGTRGDPGRL
jgi:hypothetical protein